MNTFDVKPKRIRQKSQRQFLRKAFLSRIQQSWVTLPASLPSIIWHLWLTRHFLPLAFSFFMHQLPGKDVFCTSCVTTLVTLFWNSHCLSKSDFQFQRLLSWGRGLPKPRDVAELWLSPRRQHLEGLWRDEAQPTTLNRVSPWTQSGPATASERAEKDHATCCFLNWGTDPPNEEWTVLISVKRSGLTQLLGSGLLLPTPGSWPGLGMEGRENP